MWKLRPKVHKHLGGLCDVVLCVLWLRLEHIVWDLAPRVSPLWVACYGDEDLASCLHGSSVG